MTEAQIQELRDELAAYKAQFGPITRRINCKITMASATANIANHFAEAERAAYREAEATRTKMQERGDEYGGQFPFPRYKCGKYRPE